MINNIKTCPLVSIIVPSYNKADLLIEMIGGIFKQSYKNWELIIVDDGSEEDSIRKVTDYISVDTRCRFVRRNREPKNGDTCRNIGMEAAKGEFVIIFDSDDLISLECIENRVSYMQSHPECDYASFPYSVFDNGSDITTIKKKPHPKYLSNNDILSLLLQANYPFTVWANIYRKDSLKSLRWDEKVYVYQDLDFMVQCVLANLKHEFADTEADYYYRQFSDGSNVCGNFVSKQKCDSSLYLFKKILETLKKFENYSKRKEQFKGMIVNHYERLVTGENKEDMVTFINLCKEYYDDKFVSKLERIKKKSEKVDFAGDKVRLYYTFWRTFGHPRHRTLLLMNIKKKLLH